MKALNYITVISMILMVFLILIQTRGATLGAGLGSSGEINIVRRGSEKTLYLLTILMATTFSISLVIRVLI
ncbi:MAG TPA: preprotein translocase subunit SecG [Candidatus Saccharimonadales bacterium]|nr:preprotein translocase subunit SecG [Candidatus Saccharimonadales bacterium]